EGQRHRSRIAEPATPAGDEGDERKDRNSDQPSPSDALPDVPALEVAELVRDDELDLPRREAAVEHRVPDEDPAARADADRKGIGRARLRMHRDDANGRSADVLAGLETPNLRRKGRRPHAMRSNPLHVRQ